MTDNLWYISFQECKDKLIDCENYGYGLDKRKMKKFILPIYKSWYEQNNKTIRRHKESYQFWNELYCHKLLHSEGKHWPVRVIEPRWEMEIILDYWIAYFSYSWQGAKTDRSPIYK